MKTIKEEINPDFKPQIETRTIQFLQCDYELNLKDLKNCEIYYDKQARHLTIHFEPIYIYSFEKLIKIDSIFYSWGTKAKLNGFYELLEHKPHLLTISQELENYFQSILDGYYQGTIQLNVME